MVNIKINGLDLRFTMGTMMAIASMNPNGDALSPLTGLPSSLHGAYILFGARAAYDEKQGNAPIHSIPDCEAIVKDFTGKQYVALINAYNQLINVDTEEDITKSTDDDVEGKSSKKK